VHNDVPAALPLTAFIAGLAIGPLLVNPHSFLAGLIAVAILSGAAGSRGNGASRTFACAKTATLFVLFLILGIASSIRLRPVPQFDSGRFITIDVPLDRDWTERDQSFLLRASQFHANGAAIEAPISVYARFEPPDIALQRMLHAEALLHTNEAGVVIATVKAPQLMTYGGDAPRWHPATWNRMLANRLESRARDYPDEVALAQALLLGRGERLSREMRESFRRGGTYHLLVFSGLQIAFAAGVLAMLLRWLHAPRASDWLLLVFAALAPPFIGGTASVSRASIAIGLYALSRILKRPTSLENLWCVAALLRLILEPSDLTDVSFHLTYAGAGALLFIGRPFRRPFGHLVGAEVAITPLTLFHFNQYALGGSIITMLLSPVIFAMLVVSAIACAWPHDFVFEIIRLLHRCCAFLNEYGFSGWFASPPVAVMLAAAALALLALQLRARKRAVAIAVVLLIPTVAAVVKSRDASRIEDPRVTFLDVGQGDATAIRTRDRTILVDGGRSDRVLSLLAERGVRSIDVAILTHAHPDHCAGLARVVEEMRVGSLWISPRRFRGDCADLMLRAASASRTPIHLVRDEDALRFDSLTIVAHLAGINFRQSPENNSSIVLRVETGQRRFLLTGDIEREAEITLGDRDLQADVLKVAHHGSRTSSSPRFLALVQPRIAVISCGRRNLFGHPHPLVLDALRDQNARILRTDLDGTIDIEVRERSIYARSAID
jgi:competence protein ComEC